MKQIKSVKIVRQFGIEEALMVKGAKSSGPIPLKGIPENIRDELVKISNEKINTANKSTQQTAERGG